MFIRYLILWFIVVGFLPNNAKLIKPIKPEGVRSIQFRDLDRDGIDEVVATYKVTKGIPEVHVMILKKSDKKWTVTECLKANGYEVDQVAFKDIDEDGIDEVFLGCNLGGVWKHINVYKVGNFGYEKIYNNIYSEMEIKSD